MKKMILALIHLAAPAAYSSQNYIINCNPDGLGCAVNQTAELPNSKLDFHATFKLKYRFTCGATSKPYRSEIFAYASINQASKTWFDYIGQGEVTTTGYGPVKFGDDDAGKLAGIYVNPTCGLYIDALVITPSDLQISTWSEERAGHVRALERVRDLYSKRQELLFWKSMYSQDPESFRPIIQQKIDQLRKEAEDDPLAETDLDQWEAILSKAPDEAMTQAFASVKKISVDIIARARNLIEAKERANLPRDVELEKLCNETESTLKEGG